MILVYLICVHMVSSGVETLEGRRLGSVLGAHSAYHATGTIISATKLRMEYTPSFRQITSLQVKITGA